MTTSPGSAGAQKRDDGRISVGKLVYSFVPPFDPDGEIIARKAKEAGVSVADIQAQWDEKKNRSIEKGNTINDYFAHACAERPGLYVGSRLPEFDQIDEFLKAYKVVSREEWVKNDVVFGRYDCIAEKIGGGGTFLVEIKTGQLSDTSFESMLPPFESEGTSKRDLALLQAAMYMRCAGHQGGGMVANFQESTWRGYPVETSHLDLADRMFEYQRRTAQKS